jgi:signal transduction histidine kinase
MKLTRKLTLAIALGVVAVLVIAGIFRVRREVELFESDMSLDHHTVSTTLAAAAAEVWRLEGIAEARDVLAHSAPAGERAGIRVRWVEPRGVRAPELDRAASRALESGRPADVIDEVAGTFVTFAPINGPSGAHALVEISESLEHERSYVRHTLVVAIAATGAIALVSVVIAFALGTALVGRPVGALRDKARRVGRGDLSGPLELAPNDELGELAGEMNAMCDQLRDARERAESEMQIRIAVLEQLRHADRLATVGKLASGIAHELGTPLNVIYGRARMLETGEAREGVALDSARIVREQAQKMSAIIRQLLDFARQKGPDRARHDLRELTLDTVRLLAPLAAKGKIELRVDGDEQPALASVAPSQIEQALSNLIVNAIHASPPGETVRLRVETVDARAPAPDSRTERYVRIKVSDHGPGMSPEVARRVFEPFFTTKQVGEGTGLGLSVAYGIAREHGGFIDIDTGPGRGTTFALHLAAA